MLKYGNNEEHLLKLILNLFPIPVCLTIYIHDQYVYCDVEPR